MDLRLPSGRSLPPEMWERRHRGIVAVLALHGIGLAAFGLYMRAPATHALVEGGIVAAFAGIAYVPKLSRRVRSIIAAMGLMTASAVLTHLSGGYIEAHFHFFVTLGIIFLYEDWLPYMLAVGYVAIHHGVAGTLDPTSVYNHPGAIASPWTWAGIHAVFIFGLSIALVVAWNVVERARISETKALSEAQDLKRQLGSQEKMAALGSLVAGLAHEVRTPLTAIGTNASLIENVARRSPDPVLTGRIVENTHEIQSSVDRINGLVLQLRRFHSLAPDETRVAALDAVVREAVRLFGSANKTSRAVEVDLEPTPATRLDTLGVHQIVLNLLSNALDATDPTTGVVRVRTRLGPGYVALLVEDNGMGMSPIVQARAFDPLFTTKADGMGLGLHIVKRIVDAHAGTIQCVSREGQGTTFEVRFPAPGARPATSVPVDEGSARTVAVAPG